MNEHLGIIAGSGQFPLLVSKAAKEKNCSLSIVGFNGHTDPELKAIADNFLLLPLGKIEKLISFFKKNGVTTVCLAGAIKKPKLAEFRPDLRAAKLFFKLKSQGDDALLRAFAEELQKEGFKVVQAADLVPKLQAPSGILTNKKPDEKILNSIQYGWKIGHSLGNYDIGQCLVIQKEMVVAIEAVEGTDECLKRGGELGGEGCIALKMMKPRQDNRLDLPALGLNTIKILAEHKYSCLVYEAQNCLFFDLEESIELANKHKLCIMGLSVAEIATLITT